MTDEASGRAEREKINELCRKHGLLSQRMDPGGRVLVFPKGEVRLYEMPGSDAEDLARVMEFLGETP